MLDNLLRERLALLMSWGPDHNNFRSSVNIGDTVRLLPVSDYYQYFNPWEGYKKEGGSQPREKEVEEIAK